MFLPGILLQANPASPGEPDVLQQMLHADPVVQFTLLVLLTFSVISWAIILYKAFQLSKAKKRSQQFLNQFENSPGIDTLLTQPLSDTANPLHMIFSSGVYDIIRHRQSYAKDPSRTPALNADHIQRGINRGLSDEIARLEQLTPFLATTASASPFIGLFGTVWGILTAFWKIGNAGSTSLAVVGPHISEALIATAIGLAAAIPAVIAYNFFVSKIKILSKTLEDFSMDLMHRIEKEYF